MLKSHQSIIPMLALALAGMGASQAAMATETRLIAGGGNPASAIDVGKVVVTEENGELCIRYEIEADGWCLTEVHLEVKTSLDEIPQARGNPIPGRFTYKADLDCADGWTKCLPITWPEGTKLYVAAHGVVEGGCRLEPVNPEAPCPELPEEPITLIVQQPGTTLGIPSYFDLELSGAGDLDGTYDAWCLTTQITIRRNTLYQGLMICTYDPEFQGAGIVDHPGNIDWVNCLLNQDIVGQPSAGGFGNYTYGDLQTTIWLLLEDDPNPSGTLGEVDSNRVAELLARAAACGDDFVPGCDQVVGVAIVPFDQDGNIRQPVIITVPVPCVPTDCESETAWGEGPSFPGRNWFMYFNHTIENGAAQTGSTEINTSSSAPKPGKPAVAAPARRQALSKGDNAPAAPGRIGFLVR